LSSRDIFADFYARDKGVTATLNKINGGLSNTGRMAQSAGNQMSYTEKQIRAIGTTLRYAFAGEVIMQMRQAYQNLVQFQQGLANVAAIGQQAGREIGLTQNQIDGLGEAALRTSVKTATAASDILDTYRSIYSSLQNVKPQEVAQLGELFTKGAAVSETDPRTFGQALITQMQSFNQVAEGQNPFPALAKDADEFFTVIQRSVNLTGDQLANFYGRITAAARFAGMTPEQMNAFIILASRGGGSAGFFTRNLAQLLQRLRVPTQQASKAYAQAGISRVQAANMGGFDIFMRLLQHAYALSGGTKYTQDQLDKLSQTKQGRAQIREMGGKAFKGRGGLFLQEAVGGRYQSLQAFEVLAPQIGSFNNEVKELDSSTGRLNAAFNRFIDQDPLQSMSVATQSFITSLTSKADPLFRIMARGIRHIDVALLGGGSVGHVNPWINKMIDRVAGGHSASKNDLARFSELAIAGTFLAGGSLALFRHGRLGSTVGGLTKATQGPLDVEAGISALRDVATGTRSAPFWVVIHPLSWKMGGFGGAGSGSGGHNSTTKWAENKLKYLGPFAARYGLKGIAVGGLATSVALADILAIYTSKNSTGATGNRSRSALMQEANGYPAVQRFLRTTHRIPKELADAFSKYNRGALSPGAFQAQIQDYSLTHKLNKAQNRMGLSVASSDLDKFFAALDLNIIVTDQNGKVLSKERRKGVPTTFWKNGTPPPTSRGRQSTHKSGT
jgi:hypothetical protein